MANTEQEKDGEVKALWVRANCETVIVAHHQAHAASSKVPSSPTKWVAESIASRQFAPPTELRNKESHADPEHHEKYDKVARIVEFHLRTSMAGTKAQLAWVD
jgi:hypothetical protein